jgi:multidrug efflux pump subunit AcrB
VLLALGFSANTITLFALILAIGLVVDDAIVVVENVQRVMVEENLLSPAKPSIKAMGQVTGPIIATTLVMMAVFVPVGFLPGITGQLYKQFAVTIITAVLFSAGNALTLSPALCAVLLRPLDEIRRGPLALFFRGIVHSRNGYVAVAGWLARRLSVVLVIFIAVVGSAYFLYSTQARPVFCPARTRASFSSMSNCPNRRRCPAPGR